MSEANKPIVAVDPEKCTVAGPGVLGGYAVSPTSFVLTVKDSDGINIPNWGGQIVVKVVPRVEVGGSDIDGVVMDQGDGTYSVTYAVPQIGYYMVNVECNGFPIIGSPFPVLFFCAGVSEKDKAEMLQRTVQVGNLVPNITAEQLKRVFGVRATIVECTISDREHVAYIEYSKHEQAAIAVLALNNLELGGRNLKVEMAKSLPPKPATRSPRHLKLKSRSISRSPVNQSRNRRSKLPIRSRRKSRSLSPKAKHSRHYRTRSPALHRHYSSYDRRSYRDVSDRRGRRDSYGSRDYHGSASRRHISRNPSHQGRESYRERSDLPKYRRRSSKHQSKSPDHHRGGRSSTTNDDERKSKQQHRLRSRSVEDRDKSSKRTDGNKEKITHHGRRQSRSVSCEKKRHSGERLTPGISDDNMPTRRKPSKSRSVEAKHNSEERVSNSKHRKRRRSSSVDGDTRRRVSNEKQKYKDRRRSRSQSVEDDRKAETRKRNRSRSADRETNRRGSHAKRKSVDGRRSR